MPVYENNPAVKPMQKFPCKDAKLRRLQYKVTNEPVGIRTRTLRTQAFSRMQQDMVDAFEVYVWQSSVEENDQPGPAAWGYRACAHNNQRLKKFMLDLPQILQERIADFDEKYRKFAFISRALQVFDNPEELECPICMDAPEPDEASMAGCGHVACTTCWADWLKTQESCPVCRTAVKQKDLYPVGAELASAGKKDGATKKKEAVAAKQKRAEEAENDNRFLTVFNNDEDFSDYGSKIQKIVQVIQQIIWNCKQREARYDFAKQNGGGAAGGGGGSNANDSQGNSQNANGSPPQSQDYGADPMDIDVEEPAAAAGKGKKNKKKNGQQQHSESAEFDLSKPYQRDKIILFCQWDDLKKKIEVSLRTYNLPFIMLKGAAAMKTKTLRLFGESKTNSPRILLLSLESAASGANLQMANHVLFAHPMNAVNVDKAIAYELQAIGRIRRLGQERKEIHVWRFVTQDTVEWDITQHHKREIAKRDEGKANIEENNRRRALGLPLLPMPTPSASAASASASSSNSEAANAADPEPAPAPPAPVIGGFFGAPAPAAAAAAEGGIGGGFGVGIPAIPAPNASGVSEDDAAEFLGVGASASVADSEVGKQQRRGRGRPAKSKDAAGAGNQNAASNANRASRMGRREARAAAEEEESAENLDLPGPDEVREPQDQDCNQQ